MEIKQRQIVIKPIVRPQFSGIAAHAGTSVVFQGAQIDANSGTYKTGLTVAEETEFEKALNLTPGTLNKRNAEFWGNLPIRLNKDKTTYIEIVSVLDELKYRTLLERSTVANSDLEKLKNPQAQFYIEDVEAKAKVEELIIDAKFDAFEKFNNLTTDEKKGYLRLYGKRGVDNLSDKIIKTELYKEIDKDPKKFLTLANDADITLRISIEEMLESGRVKKKGNYYSFENEILGSTIDSVIAYFKDIKNQSMKIAVENEVKQAKKGK